LAFVGRLGGDEGIYLIDTNGGVPSELTSDPRASFGAPAWIEGGEAVLVPKRDEHGWRLWRLLPGSHAPPTPFAGPGWCSVRVVGNSLYGVRVDRPGIWRIDGSPRLVAPGPSAGHCDEWAAAPHRVATIDRGNPAYRRIAIHFLDGRGDLSLPAPQMDMNSEIALNPHTGEPLYVRQLVDSSIALLHLVRE
jgi:hypothetical protein